jgi:hypothetical protein
VHLLPLGVQLQHQVRLDLHLQAPHWFEVFHLSLEHDHLLLLHIFFCGTAAAAVPAP